MNCHFRDNAKELRAGPMPRLAELDPASLLEILSDAFSRNLRSRNMNVVTFVQIFGETD